MCSRECEGYLSRVIFLSGTVSDADVGLSSAYGADGTASPEIALRENRFNIFTGLDRWDVGSRRASRLSTDRTGGVEGGARSTSRSGSNELKWQ